MNINIKPAADTFKVLIILAILAICAIAFQCNRSYGQQPNINMCPEAEQIVWDSTYCWSVHEPTTALDSVHYCNPHSFIHPDSGCWSSINLGRWFYLETGNPPVAPTTINASGDLCANWGNCGCMVIHYYLFNACPEEGGTILSYPSLAIGTGDFECWEGFGNNEIDILDFCIETCGALWDGTCWSEPMDPYPAYNSAGNGFDMTIQLQPNTEYWLCLAPTGNCNGTNGAPGASDNYTWGDLCLTISGPNVLDITQFIIERDKDGLPWFTIISDNLKVWVERSTNLEDWTRVENPDTEVQELNQEVIYYRAGSASGYTDVIPFEYTPTLGPPLWWIWYDTSGRKLK